jgi:hypothetical protein
MAVEEKTASCTMAEVTAERIAAINQFGDMLHGLLDRINGTRFRPSFGPDVEVKIPNRKSSQKS